MAGEPDRLVLDAQTRVGRPTTATYCCALFALVGAFAASGGLDWHSNQSHPSVGNTPSEWLLLVGGDTAGYLSPCGCTNPMTGGIRRRASAVRNATIPGKTVVLENGAMVNGNGRQDQMKAETMAQAVEPMDVAALNLAVEDARLGPGFVRNLSGFSGHRLISTSLERPQSLDLSEFARKGPFLIGGVSARPDLLENALGEKVRSMDDAVGRLIAAAKSEDHTALLLLDGEKSDAEHLAAQFPALALIVFRSTGAPELVPEKVGQTVLVSPGDAGKYELGIRLKSGPPAYTLMKLGPDYPDDPEVSRLYRAYLDRVDQEQLLSKLPRTTGPKFVGSAKCGACHGKPFDVWKRTGHAHALKTLAKEGHARDPDCVGCHVTGLDSKLGFVSADRTPGLAFVGCESCHGSGAAHVLAPQKHPFARVKQKICLNCHTSTQSPDFNYLTYWPKIAH